VRVAASSLLLPACAGHGRAVNPQPKTVFGECRMLPVSTLLAGTAFVALAAVNVGLMLEASRPTCSAKLKSRLITFHRIGGYVFAILLCIMV
jgi:hypothetical protein